MSLSNIGPPAGQYGMGAPRPSLAPELVPANSLGLRTDDTDAIGSCLQLNRRTVIVAGRWLKIASVRDEEWLEGEAVPHPHEFITDVSRRAFRRPDLFTFGETVVHPEPRYEFPCEWESVAAIRTSSYADWWNNKVSSDLRKDVRRAAKRGVEVRAVPFTDALVEGIKAIYDETPIRQGRPFWHYRKSIEEIRRANATYLERSTFLGAYCGRELVGFIKIVFVDQAAKMMQIIAKDQHRDKRPMNALIAKAVELAEARGCSHLTYGHYCYAQGADSVTAFKHRNGFEEILVARYYVPITERGRIALAMGLHRGIRALMPGSLLRLTRQVRSYAYEKLYSPRDCR